MIRHEKTGLLSMGKAVLPHRDLVHDVEIHGIQTLEVLSAKCVMPGMLTDLQMLLAAYAGEI